MQLDNTSDIRKVLTSLGMTLNESEIYLLLLKNGLTYGSDVYSMLDMDKSSSYRSLKSLMEKSLVYKLGEERNQQFGANPPSVLQNILEIKKDKLKQTEKQLKKLTSNLDEFVKKSYQKNVAIIEGKEGYKFFMESRLGPDVVVIRELVTRSVLETYTNDYTNYISNYIKKRVDQKIKLKTLIRVDDEDEFDRSSQKLLKEVRSLPENFDPPALFSTWSGKTGLFSSNKGSVIGVIIDDKLITQLMNNMFDTIWGISEKI